MGRIERVVGVLVSDRLPPLARLTLRVDLDPPLQVKGILWTRRRTHLQSS